MKTLHITTILAILISAAPFASALPFTCAANTCLTHEESSAGPGSCDASESSHFERQTTELTTGDDANNVRAGLYQYCYAGPIFGEPGSSGETDVMSESHIAGQTIDVGVFWYTFHASNFDACGIVIYAGTATTGSLAETAPCPSDPPAPMSLP